MYTMMYVVLTISKRVLKEIDKASGASYRCLQNCMSSCYRCLENCVSSEKPITCIAVLDYDSTSELRTMPLRSHREIDGS